MTELVFKGSNKQVLTSSVLVAKKFGKAHKHVLDSVRKILSTAENSSVLLMFAETQYVDDNNKEQPMFVMNRDGFMLLAMGFTGKKAMEFKLDFISAFNEMERVIKEQDKPKSQLEILVESAQALLEQSRRLDNVESRLAAMEQEREENTKLLLAVSVSQNELPRQTLRSKIIQLVNKYASAMNLRQDAVWHKIYEQLYYLFRISINNYKKLNKKERKLDIAERNNLLDKIYDIISNMIREAKIA